MNIAMAEVLVASPGRNFVTLRITTDDGLTGLGDATLNGRELAVAAYLRDHVAPLLPGRDAGRIEDTWQYLYRGAYWRRGPVTMAAIAAVDTALWDIKAKAAGLPLYQLLGGRSRDGLLVYGHASGGELPELFDSIREHLEKGYRAVRVQSGIPGLGSVYGVASSPKRTGRRRQPLRLRTRAGGRPSRSWRPGTPAPTCAIFPACSRPCAPSSARNGRCCTTCTTASPRSRRQGWARTWNHMTSSGWKIRRPGENQEALRLIRQHTTTPLAIGEVFNTIWDYKALIEEQLIDYVRSPVTHAGGITGLRRILDLAALYQVKSGMHGPTDISPVGLSAAIHLGLAIPNFGIQEYMQHAPVTHEVFRTSYAFADGMLNPSEQPGLGVDYDAAAAAAFPYEAAYLPVNRLRDGTMHDW